jgi:hypothetical protein
LPCDPLFLRVRKRGQDGRALLREPAAQRGRELFLEGPPIAVK